jgi:predicted cupin superfamily sugar epimerase
MKSPSGYYLGRWDNWSELERIPEMIHCYQRALFEIHVVKSNGLV